MDTIVGEEPEQLSLVSIVVVGKVNVVECLTRETAIATTTISTSNISHHSSTTSTTIKHHHNAPHSAPIARLQFCCSSISAHNRMWQDTHTHTASRTHMHTHTHSARQTHTHWLRPHKYAMFINVRISLTLLTSNPAFSALLSPLSSLSVSSSGCRRLSIGADIPFRRRQHTRLPGHLHGAQPAPHRQSVSGLISDCGSLCGLAGDDIRRRQRFAG